MKLDGDRPMRTRRHKVKTDSRHTLGFVSNILDSDFLAEAVNRKWAGDITYIWANEGWLYLAVVVDLFSRRVIGCGKRPDEKGSRHQSA